MCRSTRQGDQASGRDFVIASRYPDRAFARHDVVAYFCGVVETFLLILVQLYQRRPRVRAARKQCLATRLGCSDQIPLDESHKGHDLWLRSFAG